jgi:predicted nucleic acid-binding protein
VGIDLAALLRRHKPEKRQSPLETRHRSALPRLTESPPGQRLRLLADTGVYIALAGEKMSGAQAEVLARSEVHHCSVCVGEIAVGLANRDVAAAGWPAERRHWEKLVRAMPKARVHTPDAETWAAAGIVAGTLTRLQRFQPHQRKDALNDALVFLTAMKHGLIVLTENRRDFDWLQQLVPDGRFLLL